MKNKIKLVFVLPDLVAGGAERVMSFIANNISKEHFETSLWLAGYEKDSAFKVDTIEVKCFNKSRILTAIPGFLKTLRKEKPDLVISSIAHLNTAMALTSVFFPKIKFIGREANVLSVFKNHNKSTGRLGGIIPLSMSYKLLDLVLCQSQDMFDDMKKNFNIPDNKLRVINNPITDEFKLKTEIKKDITEIRFITVARLKQQKGHERVIKSLSQLKFHYHYTIIGDGPEKEHLFNLIKEYEMEDRVTHIPYTNEVPKYLAESDLYLQGSFVEGFPNAIIESCMVGTPVLAINAPGGINEIIYDGINGHVVPDEETFTKYLNAINSNYKFIPRDVSETIKSRYSPEIILNKYKDLFLSLVN
jgi:glycosyltransferase involved in cell wall biosynthesis